MLPNSSILTSKGKAEYMPYIVLFYCSHNKSSDIYVHNPVSFRILEHILYVSCTCAEIKVGHAVMVNHPDIIIKKEMMVTYL